GSTSTPAERSASSSPTRLEHAANTHAHDGRAMSRRRSSRRRGALSRGHVLAVVLGALALGGVLFACGSDDAPPPCEGAACVDGGGTEGSTPEGGSETSTTDDGGDGGLDGGNASDTGTNCTGPAGTLDPTFGNGGMVVLAYPNETANAKAVVVQPDGRIVVGGEKTSTAEGFALVRLLANGTLDTTFGTGGLVETKVGNTSHVLRALALQPDGKILAAGYTRFVGQNFDFAVLRYASDGTLDPTFGTAGIVLTDFTTRTDQAMAMALMADGRILVAGQTLSDDLTVAEMAFARYNPDGSLDTTFGSGGRATVDVRGTPDQARGIVPLPGGKILAAGTSRDPAVSRTDMVAVRLNADGALDTTFGNAGFFLTNFGGPGSHTAQAIVIDSAGRPLLGGFYGTTAPRDFIAIRLTAAGAFDATFGDGGVATADFQGRDDNGSALLVEQGDRYVLAGSSLPASPTPEPRMALSRHLPTGALDPTFGTTGRALVPLPIGYSGTPIAGAALAPCGVVVVGGWNDDALGLSAIGVARFRR
ncbi:MAG: hypothetical protein KC657_39415, partial [Myxococcales bacterium]|nr:hypothetical protein [Myxococcales bacterium]